MRVFTYAALSLVVVALGCDEATVPAPATQEVVLEKGSFLLDRPTRRYTFYVDTDFAEKVLDARKGNDATLDSVKEDIRTVIRKRLLAAVGEETAVVCRAEGKEKGDKYYLKKGSMELRVTGAASCDVPIEIAGVTGRVKYSITTRVAPRFNQTEAEDVPPPFNVEEFSFWAIHDVQLDGDAIIGWAFPGHYRLDANDFQGKRE